MIKNFNTVLKVASGLGRELAHNIIIDKIQEENGYRGGRADETRRAMAEIGELMEPHDADLARSLAANTARVELNFFRRRGQI